MVTWPGRKKSSRNSETKWLKIEFWGKGKTEKVEGTVNIFPQRTFSPWDAQLGSSENVARRELEL